MRLLRQSTAVDVPVGPFLDSSDGVTPETGLTLSQADFRLKKNNGDWAQKNQTSAATHEENGNYEVSLNATDTDTLGLLRVYVNEAGALPVCEDFMVVPANVYDALVAGSDALQVDVTQFGGTNGTFASGVPAVNLGTDLYHADICFTRDQTNTQDEYTVTWFKNGVRLGSGVTSPTIQVVKRADGTDLVAATAMTQVGLTGTQKLDVTGLGRVTQGEPVLVLASATIDGGTRSFSRLVSRDS